MKLADLAKRVAWRFVAAAITTLGGVLLAELYSATNVPGYVAQLATAVYVVALFVVVLQREAQRIRVEETKSELEEAEQKLEDARRVSHSYLFRKTSGDLSNVLLEMLTWVREANAKIAVAQKSDPEEVAAVVREALRNWDKGSLVGDVLGSICLGFEADQGPDNENAYVKATIFEATSHAEGAGRLERKYYKYPPAIFPETKEFVEPADAHSAAIRCWRLSQMEVLESVAKECDLGERWKEMQPGQHTRYGSMVCYPLIVGKPRTPDAQNLGVLTVDTSVDGYFKQADRKFLTTILFPHVIFLDLLYSLEALYGAAATALE